MKRLLFLLLTAVLISSLTPIQATTVTVSPSNPRIYSRFVYNYRSVLRDFGIEPNISDFVSNTTPKSFPGFLVKANDGFVYAVSAADIVAFADHVEVAVSDSVSKVSYPGLHVINISEKLNLAVIRLPKGVNADALEIDSIWFSDESEQYTYSARMFLKSIPMEVTGDASSISVLYNRMAASASDGYYYILPNLSYKYLYNKTTDQIANGIDSLSEGDFDLFKSLNANGDFISAMRILAGDMAARNMRQDFKCTNTTVKENEVIIEGQRGEYITFAKEFGTWRIISDTKSQTSTTTTTATYTSGSNASSSNTSASYTINSSSTSAIDHDVMGTLFTAKVMIPYDFRDQGVAGSIALGYAFRFLTMEVVFEYNSLGVYREWDYDPYMNFGRPYNSDFYYSSFLGLGLRIGGFLPIRLNDKLSLAPNLKFEWETPFLCRNGYYYINAISPMVGADLFVNIGNRGNRFFIGLQYEQKFFFDYYNLSVKNNTIGYFDVNFGFVF